MKLSIIISTYNSEEWLHKVLLGYTIQNENDFEIIVADDGSTDKTKIIVASFTAKFKHPIQHVWHEDKGFRKCRILNSAILKSNSDYLLFCCQSSQANRKRLFSFRRLFQTAYADFQSNFR